MGNSSFFFLSSLHVIGLTFPSVAYDKSNWPSLLSSEEDVISEDCFHHSLDNHGHTKKQKQTSPPKKKNPNLPQPTTKNISWLFCNFFLRGDSGKRQ